MIVELVNIHDAVPPTDTAIGQMPAAQCLGEIAAADRTGSFCDTGTTREPTQLTEPSSSGGPDSNPDDRPPVNRSASADGHIGHKRINVLAEQTRMPSNSQTIGHRRTVCRADSAETSAANTGTLCDYHNLWRTGSLPSPTPAPTCRTDPHDHPDPGLDPDLNT